MYKRFIQEDVVAALADTPVVLINGARQTGKTTLVQQIARAREGATYRTLDDAATLAAAAADPGAFSRQSGSPLIIDEVQHVPELFPAIKLEVDRRREAGRFLLTGSANVMLLPKLSESLAGRMEILTLDPLAQAEIEGSEPSLLQRLLSGQPPESVAAAESGEPSLAERVARGGYPEAVARLSRKRRASWFGSYVTTLLQRDVRDISNIEGLTDMPRLLNLLAARTAGLLNVAEVSRDAGIPHNTLKRYLALLRTVFLVRELPAWSRNIGKRLIKAPKIHLRDSGLAAYLLGAEAERLRRDPLNWGRLVETFAVNEVLSRAERSDRHVRATHFRTSAGREVDLVLEGRDGRIVGIEVKASSNAKGDDFAGMRALAEAAGPDWTGGVLLYAGDTVLPFGDMLWAVPLHALWTNV